MDDTKPVLQDLILRSDPIEIEEAVLRLPPVSIAKSTSPMTVVAFSTNNDGESNIVTY
ncbi:hypothetical protein QN277_018863 [Acacia crassicarpa]|uniref:Uncharacterized protein n=1 Tax=Acacia crassicarpa TaxID=499986 RepID=A0AAE1MT00_9FABA|nr:hypothetical protein QN277_018863 [Acacia crassicarpa]